MMIASKERIKNMKKMNSKGKYEIFCHKCGKKMQMTNGIVTEGIIRLQGKWGYFSNKDLQMHTMKNVMIR